MPHDDQPRNAGVQPSPSPSPAEEVTDDFVVRSHTLPSGLRYTTTAGRMVLRSEETRDGKSDGFRPKAEIFLVAYTADRTDDPAAPAEAAPAPNHRPVVFSLQAGAGVSAPRMAARPM